MTMKLLLSVHLCLRHDGRGAERCAGSSATAETCTVNDGNMNMYSHLMSPG